MINSKLLHSFAAAALVFAVGAPLVSLPSKVIAQTPPEEMPQGRVLQKLNLTSAQMQQIKAIRDRKKGEMQGIMQRLRQAQQEMNTLMAGNATADQIRAKFNEMQPLREQMAKMRFEQMLAMRDVLTPQQRSEMAKITQQRKEGRRQNYQQRRQMPQ